jgi:hypothetical protein
MPFQTNRLRCKVRFNGIYDWVKMSTLISVPYDSQTRICRDVSAARKQQEGRLFENFAVSHNPSDPTTGAAGADEVSAATAPLFASHAQEYQSISAQAAAFHNEFVQQAGCGSFLPSGEAQHI